MTDAPSAIKSSATRKSAAGQSRAGRWRPNSTIAATTTATLAVWPTAHATPRRQASRSRPWRVASVETAARWSGSNAWRNPSRRPRPARARRPGEPGVMAAANVAYSSGRIMEPGMIAASERRALEGIHARYAPVDARVAEILENIRRDRRAQPPQRERRLPRDGHRRREARRGAGRGGGRLGLTWERERIDELEVIGDGARLRFARRLSPLQRLAKAYHRAVAAAQGVVRRFIFVRLPA